MHIRVFRAVGWYVSLFALGGAGAVVAADWPMRGGGATGNAVRVEPNPPLRWRVDTGLQAAGERQGVRWSAELGTVSWGDPVVADGLVWVGTNNERPRDPANSGDASVLMCFRESDGALLYQYVSPRAEEGRRVDWPYASLASSPLVDGDRLWFATNRAEVVCLDIGPLHRGAGEPRVLWRLDMREQLGVQPRGVHIGCNAIHSSIAAHGGLIYVNTTHAGGLGAGAGRKPEAPSLVCLDRETGAVVWEDSSPSAGMIDVQLGSPLAAEVDGEAQVIMGQGDGWLRSFEAATGELLWEFDINPKTARQPGADGAGLSYFVATPVLYEGRIYIAAGRQPELAQGPGRLVCVDPTRRGDVSGEVVSDDGRVAPNPNSGLIWEYLGEDDGVMHLSVASVAVHDGLVIAPDTSGQVHCVDADTGERQWTWRHELRGAILSSPLIVDDTVYVGTEDGEVHVLDLAPEKRLLATNFLGGLIYASPVYANGTLYVTTFGRLYAIAPAR